MALLFHLVKTVAASPFKGRYVLAGLFARFAGKDRWFEISFLGKISATLDLAVSKYVPLRFSKLPEDNVQRFSPVRFEKVTLFMMLALIGASTHYFPLL